MNHVKRGFSFFTRLICIKLQSLSHIFSNVFAYEKESTVHNYRKLENKCQRCNYTNHHIHEDGCMCADARPHVPTKRLKINTVYTPIVKQQKNNHRNGFYTEYKYVECGRFNSIQKFPVPVPYGQFYGIYGDCFKFCALMHTAHTKKKQKHISLAQLFAYTHDSFLAEEKLKCQSTLASQPRRLFVFFFKSLIVTIINE